MSASESRSIARIIANPVKMPSSIPLTVPSDGDHDRFESDHALHPLVDHPDDAQQAEFASSFDDRQRERVHDADQGDDHTHQQQTVDGVDHEVEDRPDELAERVALLSGDVGPQVGDGLDLRPRRRSVRPTPR